MVCLPRLLSERNGNFVYRYDSLTHLAEYMETEVYDFKNAPDRAETGSLKWDRYRGKDILPMWVADMDFYSAPEILEALNLRIAHGVFGYTIPYDSVNEAVLAYLERQHSYSARASDLVWLPGLVPAINLCCRAYASPSDSVMTCTPVYPPFLSAPDFAGRALISVPLVWAGERWTFDFDKMEAAIKPNTRAFILCSPHNPVARVFDQAELRKLAAFCERHDLIIISDEIHCDLVIDDRCKHTMTAALSEEIEARTVTLMAPSKTYNLPGLACAYAVIPNPSLRQAFKKVARGIITEVNALGYVGCEAAYRFGEPWRRGLIQQLQTNYTLLRETLSADMPEIVLNPMEATYLAWLDVSALGLENPGQFFEQHGVGLSDGTPFGDGSHLRLNFGCPEARLTQALERMKLALKQR